MLTLSEIDAPEVGSGVGAGVGTGDVELLVGLRVGLVVDCSMINVGLADGSMDGACVGDEVGSG